MVDTSATQFEPIRQAMQTALEVLEGTVPVCQALADAGEGYVCAGCPAEGAICAVQVARDFLKRSLSRGGPDGL
ncbi:MAG: hypothetical protein QMD46_12205 [Methanomicrobiales archaeon]|nr:hypothetical protein [Methanomicrobiales archaeon]